MVDAFHPFQVGIWVVVGVGTVVRLVGLGWVG